MEIFDVATMGFQSTGHIQAVGNLVVASLFLTGVGLSANSLLRIKSSSGGENAHTDGTIERMLAGGGLIAIPAAINAGGLWGGAVLGALVAGALVRSVIKRWTPERVISPTENAVQGLLDLASTLQRSRSQHLLQLGHELKLVAQIGGREARQLYARLGGNHPLQAIVYDMDKATPSQDTLDTIQLAFEAAKATRERVEAGFQKAADLRIQIAVAELRAHLMHDDDGHKQIGVEGGKTI